jgi:hypothetical protein
MDWNLLQMATSFKCVNSLMTRDGLYCFAYSKWLNHTESRRCPVNTGSGCIRGMTSSLREVERIQIARENGKNERFDVFGKPMDKGEELDYLKRLGIRQENL